MEGRKILKLGHVSLSRPLLTYFLFFLLVPLVANLHAKFEVLGFNCSQDGGGPKILKVPHVTTSRLV